MRVELAGRRDLYFLHAVSLHGEQRRDNDSAQKSANQCQPRQKRSALHVLLLCSVALGLGGLRCGVKRSLINMT